jgi:hypothetical protein
MNEAIGSHGSTPGIEVDAKLPDAAHLLGVWLEANGSGPGCDTSARSRVAIVEAAIMGLVFLVIGDATLEPRLAPHHAQHTH